MSTVTSPVIERVKKLLALSNSDVPAERDAALAKANALIAEHQIDMVLLQGDQHKPEEFVEDTLEFGGRRPVETKFVAWLLHAHFRCEVVFNWKWIEATVDKGGAYVPRRKVQTFQIIARKSDAEFGRWLTGYLIEEFRRRWAYYKRTTSGVTLAHRNTFIYGMYVGLNNRLQEEAKAVEQRKIAEIAASQPTCDSANAPQTAAQLQGRYALALQDETARRKSELARRFPRLRNTTTRLNVSTTSSAMFDGMSHGRTISTNRPLAVAA